jgi:hypothetical protein
MPFTVNFGSGGTSNNGASYTSSSGVYMSVSGQTGNANLTGTVVRTYNSVTVNGTYTGCYPSYDGSNVYLNNNSPGSNMYFSRYIGNGGVINDLGGGNWTNGGLQGSYTWSTVATTPATISTSKSGRNVTVTTTAPSSDGGQTITSYSVEYRTSTNGTTFSAWGNTQTMSSLAFTYTSLTAGIYYQFRTYANNANGSSQARTSSTVLVSSGGKIYNGTAWVSTTSAKMYNGTAWVDLTTAKIFNGTAWVDLQ